MQVEQHIIKLVKHLILHHVRPVNIGIGGGYCRDKKHGITPRDVDVVIVGPFDFHEVNLPDGWCVVEDFDKESSEQYADSEEFQDRLDRVVKLLCCEGVDGPYEVDLLIFDKKYSTIREAVQANDFNLNMYLLGWREIITGLGDIQYVGEDFGPEGTLVLGRDSRVSFDRREYIKQKAIDLGWQV